ncbi:hypothetical protein [Accumulibacter sp.]|uniref:hypothetical protein n=1 Tax=Accumulibacter sp. TaxID=2053492 RepID=UPI002627B217|nr:hypothetical protein [Accumulibacter sp.]
MSCRKLAGHAEAVKQIAMADRLLISKSDRAPPAQVAAVRRTLARLDPSAEQLCSHHSELATSALANCGSTIRAAKCRMSPLVMLRVTPNRVANTPPSGKGKHSLPAKRAYGAHPPFPSLRRRFSRS